MSRTKSMIIAMAIAGLASVGAHAQDGPRDFTAPQATENAPPFQPTSPTPPREVRGLYVVIAQTMHCHDETHADWWGSDDTFFVFRDPVSNSAVMTAAFGNVDSGDTRPFTQAQSCVTPLANFLDGPNNRALSWTCGSPGVTSISFVVEAYEDDEDGALGIRSYYSYEGGECTDAQAPANCNDDLIGRAVVTHSAEQLDQWLPNVGLTTQLTVRLGGYDFTYLIQRVGNLVVDPPLEAMP